MRTYLYGTHLARSKVVPPQTGESQSAELCGVLTPVYRSHLYILGDGETEVPESSPSHQVHAEIHLFSLLAYSPLRLNSVFHYSRYLNKLCLFIYIPYDMTDGTQEEQQISPEEIQSLQQIVQLADEGTTTKSEALSRLTIKISSICHECSIEFTPDLIHPYVEQLDTAE